MKNMTFLIIVLLLISCAGHDRYEPRRGSLKEGMEKASDDYEGERKVKTEYEWVDDEPEIVVIYEETDEEKYQEDEYIGFSNEVDRFWSNVKFSTGLVKSEHFYGFHQFNLGVGGYIKEKNWFNFYVGYAHSPIQETSELHKSIDGGVHLLNIGFEWKYFTTPKYTFLGNYLLLGSALDYMCWEYKNVLEDQYGDIIKSDCLGGVEFYTGIGFNLINPYKVKLGIEISPGVILWGGNTAEGFDNDLFDPFLYLKFKIILNFSL